MNARGNRRLSAELAIIGAAFAVLWFAPHVSSEYGAQIGFRALIYLTLAEGWNLMAGSAGLVSLGTSCFVGLGAYVAFGLLNAFGLPTELARCSRARVAGGALAALVSPALFRLRGLYFTVGTLALAELLRLAMVNVPWFGGASGSFCRDDPPDLPVLFRYALAVALRRLRRHHACARTRASVILRAVRDDEDAAAQMGVRPSGELAAFMAASALAAHGGLVQAVKLGAIEPYGMFGLQWSIDVLSMVIIGGVGLRLGPLVGAIFVVALGEALADYPEAHIAIAGVILIVLIRFAPRGVVGFWPA